MTPTPRAVSRFGLAAMEARAASAQPAAPVRLDRPHRRTVVRLWLPLTPIFLLLAPFAILLSPLIWFAPPPYGRRPFATVMGLGGLLLSLGGAVVEVDSADALVRIKIF